jgi:Ca-activated chloride channel family protein
MKSHRIPTVLLVLIILTLFSPIAASADGIIIPDPPICVPGPCPGPIPIAQLAIRYHHVDVTIEDQIAVTHIDQVFTNPNDWQVEGTYIFPLPVDATVTEFILWIDGEPVQGEVLDAEEARQTYEEIVRKMQDPALLEYVDRGAVQASIFPIPPGGERRIELEYSQPLTAENGLVRYVYPLNTEKFSVKPLESVSVSVEVISNQPIRAIYSPTHPVSISRESRTHVIAGYEDSDVTPDADFALYYSIGEAEAFHLLSYRDPSDKDQSDGFFLLMLAPRPDVNVDALPKDVLVVLDKSGSMDGEKFRQAQEALIYILEHLNKEDRFNIISFSTGTEAYASRLQPASEAKEAVDWVERLSAEGSTDINRALLEAADIAGVERPTYILFLTDGVPTEGVIESQMILENLEDAASDNLRLFAFGVGYDVDTFLLDSLAEANHGTSTYVLPGEPLDEIISGFYAKVSTPVLTDLELDFGDLVVYDLYPEPLPDLFSGSQIVLVGRYRDGGEETVILSGKVNQEVHTFTFRDQYFTTDSRGSSETEETLPRLWATRKIGYLLNKIRLNGPDQETIDQIVRLSIRYGIVTPYTSYLVTESMPLGAAEQNRIAEETFQDMEAMPSAPTFGQEAVEKALEQGALEGAEVPAPSSGESADLVRNVGSHTFVYTGGVWVDTAFDPDIMKTVEVAFLSDDYFELAGARPELGDAFALGGRVIALSDGVAYEVIEPDAPTTAIEIPPTYEAEEAGGPSSPVAGGEEEVETSPSDGETGVVINLPCLGGMLPLSLLPLCVFLLWRRR